MLPLLRPLINYCKPLMSATFIAYFTALHTLAHNWLPTLSSVAGATSMNEFASYTILVPPLQQIDEDPLVKSLQ